MRALVHEAAKFGVVGTVGFVVDVGIFNLLRFAGDPGVLEHKPLTAKAISVFCATVVTYLGNRHWTFRERRGNIYYQGARFLVVSAVSLGLNLLLLRGLVGLGVEKIAAQAIAIILVTPFSFGVNKLWSFRR